MIDRNSTEIINIIIRKLAEKNPEFVNTFAGELINTLLTSNNDIAEFFGNNYKNLDSMVKELKEYNSRVRRAAVNFKRNAYSISLIHKIYNELTSIYGDWLVKHNFNIQKKDEKYIILKLGEDQKILITTYILKKHSYITLSYITKNKPYGYTQFPINCYKYAARRAIKICKTMICQAKDKNLCS